MRFSKSIRGNLCEECARTHFNEYTLTTLFLGWWGVISCIMTPFILIGNILSYNSRKNVIPADDGLYPQQQAYGYPQQQVYGYPPYLPEGSSNGPGGSPPPQAYQPPPQGQSAPVSGFAASSPQETDGQDKAGANDPLHKWDLYRVERSAAEAALQACAAPNLFFRSESCVCVYW